MLLLSARGGVALLLLPALAGVACQPSAEKREAREVVASVERLRLASEGPERVGRVAELEALVLTTPEAKAARDKCVEAYRSLEESTQLIRGLEQKRAAGTLDLAAADELGKAQKKLHAAKTAGIECHQALGVLAGRLR